MTNVSQHLKHQSVRNQRRMLKGNEAQITVGQNGIIMLATTDSQGLNE